MAGGALHARPCSSVEQKAALDLALDVVGDAAARGEVARNLTIGAPLLRAQHRIEPAAPEAGLGWGRLIGKSAVVRNAIEASIIRHGSSPFLSDPRRFRFSCCCAGNKKSRRIPAEGELAYPPCGRFMNAGVWYCYTRKCLQRRH